MVLGAGGVEPRPYGGQEDLRKPGVGRTEASAPTEGFKKCGERADVGIGPSGGVQEVR